MGRGDVISGDAMTTTDCTEEFSGVALGDKRLNVRLNQIAGSWGKDPSKSIPLSSPSGADLEATYRFLNNPAATPQFILEPHFCRTADRARAAGEIVVAHDTTVFSFAGERQGLGPVLNKNGKQGFYAHCALGIGLRNEGREPLGLLGTYTWTRGTQGKARSRSARRADRSNENLRWSKMVDTVESRLCEAVRATHVMDREADSYPLLVAMQEQDRLFVVRAVHNRVLGEEVAEDARKLLDAESYAKTILEREVPLTKRISGKRLPQQRRIHPPRRARKAKLSIAAIAVTLRRSGCASVSLPQTLPIHVVFVRELDTPADEAPIHWILLTNRPIETEQDVASVVDCYRARWVIEEYFKALKTGCEYQKLQLESYDALLRALAIYMPIAWMLLLLRTVARSSPETPAKAILTQTQLTALRAVAKQPLPQQATAQDVLMAIAALGGHIKYNGPPGWLVIARGLRDLMLIAQGWAAAQELRNETCDQS